jgi:tetratricopeptide (TPR) repeat protein
MKSIVPVLLALLSCGYLFAEEINIGDVYDQSVYMFEQNKWEEALTGFEKIHKEKPGYKKVEKYLVKSRKKASRFHYNLGINLYGQGKFEDAMGEFRKSVEIDGKYTKARAWLDHSRKKIAKFYFDKGEEYYKEKKWQEAITSLEMSVKYGDYSPQHKAWVVERISGAKKEIVTGLYTKGVELYNAGDYLKAQDYLEKVIKYDSKNSGAKDYLEKVNDRLAEKDKEDYLQGIKEYDQGNLKKAIELWENVLKNDPANMNAANNLERARKELEKK